MDTCVYSYPDTYPTYIHGIFCAIFSIYGLVIIIVNLVLMVSFFATKQSMQNISNLLIVCLCVSDCLIGMILMPVMALEGLLLDSKIRCFFANLSFTLQLMLGGTSFGITMLLATDRYLHMNPDFQSNSSRIAKFFKRPRIYILILSCFAFSAAVSLMKYFMMGKNTRVVTYFTAFYAIFVLIMLTVFVVFYTCSYLRIRRFVAENPVYQSREEPDSNESPVYLKALFKTVLLVIITAVVCWLPLLALNIAVTVLRFMDNSLISSTLVITLGKTALALFFANSFINALIIFYRNKKSKEWLKRWLCSCFGQRNKEEVSSSTAVTN